MIEKLWPSQLLYSLGTTDFCGQEDAEQKKFLDVPSSLSPAKSNSVVTENELHMEWIEGREMGNGDDATYLSACVVETKNGR